MDLISVQWAGLEVHPGHLEGDFTAVVEAVEGWYDTPPMNGNDTELTLADGAQFGPKVIQARTVTLTGAAAGPAAALAGYRDQLAGLAADKRPAPLTIADRYAGRSLTAEVRGDSDAFRHTFIAGNKAFRWQAVLTCADPRLYEADWRQAVLTNLGGIDSGRRYPRAYPWQYGRPNLPNSSVLANPGNTAAPVIAVYEGELTQTRLTTAAGLENIRVAAVPWGMRLYVNTATLDAQAAGGLSRASFVLPGSRPMLLPRNTATRWSLFGAGDGQVTLTWRGAYV